MNALSIGGMSGILSLCEFSSNILVKMIADNDFINGYDDVYLGSEFCYNKLASIIEDDFDFILSRLKGLNKNAYFVFPILPEREIANFEKWIVYLSKKHINGIIVNDYGTLCNIKKHFPQVGIVLGRLLFKNTRDFLAQPNSSSRFPSEIIEIIRQFDIERINCDTDFDNQAGLENITLCLHSSTYLTSSMACEFKSTDEYENYTIGGKCAFECQKKFIKFSRYDAIRIGNAVLFLEEKRRTHLVKPITDLFVTQSLKIAGGVS
jgi:hypothetical protein